MTIDSTFIACFKEEASEAFTSTAPFEPQAVFIDGQIKLMCPSIDQVITWEDYIHRQFARGVHAHFDRGVGTVIMAFDDYNEVPKSKSMTQLSRRKHIPQLVMHDRDSLPVVVPMGEKWVQCIANRTFKTKVIQMVIHRLTSSLKCGPRQSLIIDYQGHPVVYKLNHDPTPLEDFAPLGEADVKFPRYTRMFKRLQIESVDGDSIPIALLHYEQGFDGQISIYRMVTKLQQPAPKPAVGGKRKLADLTPKKPPAPPKKREYEFVDIAVLYSVLTRNVIPQCLDRVKSPTHAGHEISMLVGVIGLAGTDFTRGLPQVSGKTLFEYLPSLWANLSTVYDTEVGMLDPSRTADLVIAAVYRRKFERHVASSRLAGVLSDIQRSKLSPRTKATMMSLDSFRCTVRNVNWLLQYWRNPTYPDPFQPQYGFVNDGGKISFAA